MQQEIITDAVAMSLDYLQQEKRITKSYVTNSSSSDPSQESFNSSATEFWIQEMSKRLFKVKH